MPKSLIVSLMDQKLILSHWRRETNSTYHSSRTRSSHFCSWQGYFASHSMWIYIYLLRLRLKLVEEEWFFSVSFKCFHSVIILILIKISNSSLYIAYWWYWWNRLLFGRMLHFSFVFSNSFDVHNYFSLLLH